MDDRSTGPSTASDTAGLAPTTTDVAETRSPSAVAGATLARLKLHGLAFNAGDLRFDVDLTMPLDQQSGIRREARRSLTGNKAEATISRVLSAALPRTPLEVRLERWQSYGKMRLDAGRIISFGVANVDGTKLEVAHIQSEWSTKMRGVDVVLGARERSFDTRASLVAPLGLTRSNGWMASDRWQRNIRAFVAKNG